MWTFNESIRTIETLRRVAHVSVFVDDIVFAIRQLHAVTRRKRCGVAQYNTIGNCFKTGIIKFTVFDNWSTALYGHISGYYESQFIAGGCTDIFCIVTVLETHSKRYQLRLVAHLDKRGSALVRR